MRETYADRLAKVGGEIGDLHEHETIWIPGYGFAQTSRSSAKYHLAAVDTGRSTALCGVARVSIVTRVIRTTTLHMFGCRDCLKALEETAQAAATVAMIEDVGALARSTRETVVRALANVDGTFSRGAVADAVVNALTLADVATGPITRSVSAGGSAHKWALDGEPLRNSTSESAYHFLDCPRCGDVILDIVNVRSGTLDTPRNTFSPLGLVWYARCPACEWTSPDRPSEWTLLEAVTEARQESST